MIVAHGIIRLGSCCREAYRELIAEWPVPGEREELGWAGVGSPTSFIQVPLHRPPPSMSGCPAPFRPASRFGKLTNPAICRCLPHRRLELPKSQHPSTPGRHRSTQAFHFPRSQQSRRNSWEEGEVSGNSQPLKLCTYPIPPCLKSSRTT